jgi:pilus assembly protein Flp/PilA
MRVKDERGASVVEYVLLLALIAIVCIVAVTSFGGKVSDSVTNSGSKLFTPAGQAVPTTTAGSPTTTVAAPTTTVAAPTTTAPPTTQGGNQQGNQQGQGG